jgi:hypothetical protein
MSGDFDVTDGRSDVPAVYPAARRRLVPMQVGSATVFVEATAEAPVIDAADDFHAVGINPTEAFETASDALKECVRVVGERIDAMQDAIRPKEVGVEFTITFDVEGQARIIPVLLTGKAKTAVGVKVSAKWQPGT